MPKWQYKSPAYSKSVWTVRSNLGASKHISCKKSQNPNGRIQASGEISHLAFPLPCLGEACWGQRGIHNLHNPRYKHRDKRRTPSFNEIWNIPFWERWLYELQVLWTTSQGGPPQTRASRLHINSPQSSIVLSASSATHPSGPEKGKGSGSNKIKESMKRLCWDCRHQQVPRERNNYQNKLYIL